VIYTEENLFVNVFLLIFVDSAHGRECIKKQRLVAGIGFGSETFAVGVGGFLHPGDLLPVLIYLSGNTFENLSRYVWLSLDFGIGFSIRKIFNTKNLLLTGIKYAIFQNGSTVGFSIGLLSDISFVNLGLYIFLQARIISVDYPLIPFLQIQISQLGVRYSF